MNERDDWRNELVSRMRLGSIGRQGIATRRLILTELRSGFRQPDGHFGLRPLSLDIASSVTQISNSFPGLVHAQAQGREMDYSSHCTGWCPLFGDGFVYCLRFPFMAEFE